MRGLSLKSITKIEKIIQDKFDKISIRLLGIIPKSNRKRIIFSATKNNLISLFLQSLGTRNPNRIEERTLKIILGIAGGYVDALKKKTTSNLINQLNAYVNDSIKRNSSISNTKIKNIINEEIKKTTNHLKLITSAESNKAVNFGTALKIKKISKEKGEDDPIVFFVVTIDERNDPETYRLHLLPDRLTPRVYKLSELGTGYHKKGDLWPKIGGTNPNCRCFLTLLMPGWSFKNGRIAYKSPNWNEFQHQRKKYGLPKQ